MGVLVLMLVARTPARETLAAPSCVDLVLTELSAGVMDVPSPATPECTPRPATLLTGLTLTCKLPPSLNKYTLTTLQKKPYLIFGDTYFMNCLTGILLYCWP